MGTNPQSSFRGALSRHIDVSEPQSLAALREIKRFPHHRTRRRRWRRHPGSAVGRRRRGRREPALSREQTIRRSAASTSTARSACKGARPPAASKNETSPTLMPGLPGPNILRRLGRPTTPLALAMSSCPFCQSNFADLPLQQGLPDVRQFVGLGGRQPRPRGLRAAGNARAAERRSAEAGRLDAARKIRSRQSC